jgi:hypothetical protein
MANELSITASLFGYKPSVMAAAVGRAVTDLLVTMSGSAYIEGVLTVLTTATVIPLGSITMPGWCFFQNQDPTNFIRIMNGSGGAKVPKMLPEGIAIFRWDETAVPYAQADTASCAMEFVIFSA